MAKPKADIGMPSWRFTKQLPGFPGAVSFCSEYGKSLLTKNIGVDADHNLSEFHTTNDSPEDFFGGIFFSACFAISSY